MKKLVSTLIAALMILSVIAVPAMAGLPAASSSAEAVPDAPQKDSEAQLYGYILYDIGGGAANVWGTFSSDAPENVTALAPMETTSYAAAFAGGKAYGFLAIGNGDEGFNSYFVFDPVTSAVSYVGTCAYVTVHAMAYNHANDTMYALSMDSNGMHYLYSVDLAYGEMTLVTELTCGDDYPSILTFAIDTEGNAYGIATSGVFYGIDLETGECTVIADTGLPIEYVQSMTFDHNTQQLFWAYFAPGVGNGLYIVDTETGELTDCGTIGGGAEICGLFTIDDIPIPPVYTEDVTVTFVNDLTGDTIDTIEIEPGTVLSESDFPEPDTYSSFDFVGWDYDNSAIFMDTTINAIYRHVDTFGWYFENEPADEGWTYLDSDGDGNNWIWTYEMMPGHEGMGFMRSESFGQIDAETYGALFPDNWLVSPQFTGGQFITFYMSSSYYFPGDVIGVYISTDGGETWSDEIDCFTGTSNYERYVVYTPEYAGQTICVAFRHYNTSGLDIVMLDEVEVAPAEEGTTPTYTPVPPTDTPEPPVTDTPEPPATDTPEPPATDTPEPTVTDTPEPPETDAPDETEAPTTDVPGIDEPSVPATGAVSLSVLGIISLISGAAAAFAARKH